MLVSSMFRYLATAGERRRVTLKYKDMMMMKDERTSKVVDFR